MADGSAKTEGGLPGMALHPDFNTTPHVFVAYNQETGGNYRERIEEVRSQKSECKNERI
jgi:aldose sugar dehydrogenase